MHMPACLRSVNKACFQNHNQGNHIDRLIDRSTGPNHTQYGTATNIKSRTNRLSVLDAITSTQQRLKLYAKVPPNGLVSNEH